MVSTKQTIILSLLLLSTMIVLTTAQAAVGDGECVTYTNVQTSACGGSVTVTGHGAVELCEDCFPCGEADGVCPNDFGANCKYCGDPDCLITLTGIIDEAGTNALVDNVKVTVIVDHHDGDYTTTTGADGQYSLQVPLGEFEVTAYHKDYAVQLTKLPYNDELEKGDTINLDFEMTQYTCASDCTTLTDIGKICEPRCDGVAGCSFPRGTYTNHGANIPYDLAQNCSEEYAGPGLNISLGIINDDLQLTTVCCDSSPTATKRYRTRLNTSKASDIHQTTTPVTLVDNEGRTVMKGVKSRLYSYVKSNN